MNRLRTIFLLMVVAMLTSACATDGLHQVTVITGGTHTLPEGLTGDLVLLGGFAEIPAEVVLEGNVHIFGGSLALHGEVNGDVAFLNGELTLGPAALVQGDLNLGTETYRVDPHAVINGQRNAGTGLQLPDLPERVPPDPLTRSLRGLITGVLVGLLGTGLQKIVPRAIRRVGEAATHHSVVSGAIGALVGLVGLSLMITIAYTILLIPVALLGLLILAAAVIFGWIGIGAAIGRAGSIWLPAQISDRRTAFLGTLLFVWVLETIAALPTIGALIGLAAVMVGLGAVALTRFGNRRFEPESGADDIF